MYSSASSSRRPSSEFKLLDAENGQNDSPATTNRRFGPSSAWKKWALGASVALPLSLSDQTNNDQLKIEKPNFDLPNAGVQDPLIDVTKDQSIKHDGPFAEAEAKLPDHLDYMSADQTFPDYNEEASSDSDFPTSFEQDSDPSSSVACDSPHTDAVAKGRPIVQYVVMIDAGSTGSRVHAYKFNNCHSTPQLEYETFKTTEKGQGLSSFAGNPLGAAKSLEPLLNEAVRVIPDELHSRTPVAVKATAGLRILDTKYGSNASKEILDAVRNHLVTNYPFSVSDRPGDVSVMDGSDEGVYAWITVNYLLGRIGADVDNSDTPTVAVMDLGGASTQIVFEPMSKQSNATPLADGDHRYTLTYGGKEHILYQHSYLGYGLMQARRSVHNLVAYLYEFGNVLVPSWDKWDENVKVPNPCISRGSSKVVTLDPPGKAPVNVTMVGSSNGWDACNRVVELVMAKDAVCEVQPCSFNGVYQPSLMENFDGPLLAMSYFYDRLSPLGINSKSASFARGEIQKMASHSCKGQQNWETYWSGNTEALAVLHDKPDMCLDLTFMNGLLGLGYELGPQRQIGTGTIIQLASLPLIVLAPLGAISLLPNVVFARVLLKDKRRELLQGIVLIVIGATLIAYHSDVTPEQHLSYDRLMELFNRSVNQAYLAIQSLATLAALGVAHIWDRSRTQSAAEATPLIGEDRKARYNGPAVLFASCSGVLSGMCLLLAKGGIDGIIENSEWRVLLHWQIGLLLAVLAIAAVVQLYYLNLALKCSDPSLISPLAFCFYNVSSILNGLVFFDQYSHTSTTDLMTISAGTVTLLVGVWIWVIDKAQISSILNAFKITGTKTLILHPDLAGPLGLIAQVSTLKHHGVDKLFWLEKGVLRSSTTNLVYFSRPSVAANSLIIQQILQSSDEYHEYFIISIPSSTKLLQRQLSDAGLLDTVTLLEFQSGFIPIEDDLLSLEYENSYVDYFLNGDSSLLYDSSTAILTLEKEFGAFPIAVGKGKAAEELIPLIKRRRMEEHLLHSDNKREVENLNHASSTFDALVVVDRSTDLITPMCIQLTYLGLIDEYIGVKNAHVEVDASLIEGTQPNNTPSTSALSAKKKKKHLLSTFTDPVYEELRDINFSQIGVYLNKIAKTIDQRYKDRHTANTVKEIKDFVGRLGGLQSEHQSLQLHTALSELLLEFTKSDTFGAVLEVQQNLLAGYEFQSQISAIEGLIYEEAPIHNVLRLIVLGHICDGNIKSKTMEQLKGEILQTYGYQYLTLLITLEEHILAHNHSFSQIRKYFALFVEDVNEAKPNDISYAYSGYAPLSLRIVQCAAQKSAVKSPLPDSTIQSKANNIDSFGGFTDSLKFVKGGIVQDRFDGLPKEDNGGMKKTLVFFVGGVTFAEIAALRLMSSQIKDRDFVVATTDILNSKTLLTQLSNS
ncbi:hypothetical protein E3P98_00483 [Wallemia ichthyophaga]|nr:hypothetical protein E3P98_00483 [Wallemia ichthyophaga]